MTDEVSLSVYILKKLKWFEMIISFERYYFFFWISKKLFFRILLSLMYIVMKRILIKMRDIFIFFFTSACSISLHACRNMSLLNLIRILSSIFFNVNWMTWKRHETRSICWFLITTSRRICSVNNNLTNA